MNLVASSPGTLQTYVMETTEVKKILLKKKYFLFSRKFSEKLLIPLLKIYTAHSFESETVM